MAAQATRSVTFNGPLLFSGGTGDVKLSPADRVEFWWENRRIEPSFSHFETKNSTSLWHLPTDSNSSSSSIALVEHLFAATLFAKGMRVDLRGNEIPILDGSAKDFYHWIFREGLSKDPEQYECKLTQRWEWMGGFIEVEPADFFQVDYTLEIGEYLDSMHYTWGEDPVKIIEARTFIFEEYLSKRLKRNDFKNPQLEMGLVVNSRGEPINHSLRHKNELAAHKILDLLGDLALLTLALPKIKIKCLNGNHQMNHCLVERIFEYVSVG